MSKNFDLIQILILVVIGMFIPFLGAITLTYGLDLTVLDNWIKISNSFLYFLLFFGLELLVVIIYFTVTNKIATKKINRFKNNK